MIDISVYLENDDLIRKYDLEYGRACAATDKHMPLLDELWKMQDFSLCVGGSALNTIRCANFLIKASQPDKCVYFGSIGTDVAGEILQRDLVKEGMHGFFHKAPGYPTSTCASLVFNKERTLCWYEGASGKYSTDHLISNFHVIDRTAVFYTTAYFLLTKEDALFEFIKRGHQNDKVLAFNLSAHYVIHAHRDKINSIIQYADYVFCNEDEAKVFAEVNDIAYDALIDVAVAIAKMHKLNQRPRTVVITQGKDPVLLAVNQGEQNIIKKEFAIAPVREDKIVDTNGAGDAFTGGFLSQIAIHNDLDTAVRAGIWMAGIIIQRSGCTFPEEYSPF